MTKGPNRKTIFAQGGLSRLGRSFAVFLILASTLVSLAQQLRAEIKQANEVLAQLAMPWETLFKDVESSQRDHVALLSIEPDSEKRVIKIIGEAKDTDAMLGYIRLLQKKESLTDVYLQSHRVEQQTAEKPIRFALIASWVVKP